MVLTRPLREGLVLAYLDVQTMAMSVMDYICLAIKGGARICHPKICLFGIWIIFELKAFEEQQMQEKL